jgi:hypothetical protein
MGTSLTRQQAVELSRLLREAERSVHYALSNRSLWPQFVEYYDERKRAAVREWLETLGGPGHVNRDHRETQSAGSHDIRSAWRVGTGLLLNRFRRAWWLSEAEARRICGVLQSLSETLQHPEPPEQAALIELRMKLDECERTLAEKLAGLPELRDVRGTDHFLHPQAGRRPLSGATSPASPEKGQ